jgi:hypothetical protein
MLVFKKRASQIKFERILMEKISNGSGAGF